MDGSKQSLSLIALLVAALLFGPMVLLTHHAGAQPLKPSTIQERIMDAVAPLPSEPLPPSATPPLPHR